MRKLLCVMWAAAALSAAPACLALSADDHERARQAFEAGEIRPLRDIVSEVEQHCGGRVIEVELEEGSRGGHHIWLYQLRMMTPKGNVLRLDVDGATTEILKVKGRGSCH